MRIKDVANVIINIEGRKYFGGGSTSPPEEGGGEGGNKDYHIVITSDSSSNGNASMYVEMSGVEGSYQIYRNETLISSGSNPADGSVYVPLENLGGKTVGLTVNVDKADSLVVNSSWTPDYENSGRTIDVKKFVSNIPHQKFTTWYSELSVPNTLPTFITAVDNMFYNCEKFNGDLSLWDMSRFTNLEYMFYGCSNFNSDLSMWDVSNVTNMEGMFLGCRRFNSNLSNWDVGKVQNFTSTFQGAEDFNSDLSNWNTVSAILMSGMFRIAHSFASFVTEWDVSNVTNMDYMFQPSSGVFTALPPQDLSKWCVANVYGAMDFINYDWSGIKPVWGTCPSDIPVVDVTVNNIGVQGASMFGVGITDNLPLGMSEMTGTRTVGHENYGNYQHSDGSIMCWIPQFFYRWGATDSPRAAKYSLNSLDVKSKHDFADVTAANAAGYAVHRAFYDDGKLQDGFFVDKYQASNNGGIASSIKNGIPLSSQSNNEPFSSLNGTPANTYAGAIDAVKTRGAAFFVTTLFVQRALSLLSMAHAQAATSVDNCAWYDSTGIANYPKGCNNNALGDFNDATVKYTETGYLKVGKTGSALPFAKTTHNGQANGVADLNGNMEEICLGVTRLAGVFYALKTTAKVSALTSGATAVNDAWGAAGITANYESLGASIGALTGDPREVLIGSGTQQVFSSATSGNEWQASCAGIPLATGVDATGTDLFGHDRFYDARMNDLCPVSGGSWFVSTRAGVWHAEFGYSRADSYYYVGVRAALYSV